MINPLSLYTTKKIVEEVQRQVAGRYRVEWEKLISGCREPYMVECKKVCYKLALEAGMTQAEAARSIGFWDIPRHYSRWTQEIKGIDSQMKNLIEEFEGKLREKIAEASEVK